MTFLSRMRRNATPMSAAGITDVGVVRSVNEDNFVVLLGRDAPAGDALLAVADGMGGHSAGEVASHMALDLLKYELSNTSSTTEQTLRRAVLLANEGVYSESTLEPSLRGMGTTLVAGLLTDGVLITCNIGDSRAYLLREGVLKQLTRDHSWVSEMVAQGTLTSEQASTHPRRNILTRALGVGVNVEVDITRVVLQRRDRLLLCSDGLHGMVNDSVISEILRNRSLKKAARELVKAAKSAGGDDNITVIVAQMDSEVPVVESGNTADSEAITLPPN